MSASHQVLKFVRQAHLYVGVFIAPALLFFAFTGGLQVFSLHETTRGSDYKPPAWLVTLAQVHKKQTTVVPVHKARPVDADSHQVPQGAAAAGAPADLAPPMQAKPDGQHDNGRHPLPLKIFFALVALGLFLSTLGGIYMAYRYTRRPGLVSFILAVGVLLPIALAFV
ncbi:MAG TPA: PepSY domain-containing protein [Dyella sp.]|uniref:PepSY domain-containing protein n=1 Tax=Dyella sp. TaxID=1869338 RepID=UPI002D07CC84|nr:PepSY domain-containing protein [Dyella sp.]HTV85908.1 PepSY domain-containing protein [Dyella sp.]